MEKLYYSYELFKKDAQILVDKCRGFEPEILDSGETMREILKVLSEKFPNVEFKLATLFYKKTAVLRPDYSVREANEWIDFFWEIDVK